MKLVGRVMDFLTSFHFLTALCMLWSLSVPVKGSLYIDCGATASYVDPITGVTWVPDSGFISTGENFANVPTAKSVWQDFPELNTLRFFNDSRAKNCYTLPVTINVTYLLTASFLWASYDNTASPPSFGLAIDGTILASVTSDATGATFDQLEFSIQPPNNFTYVCLTQLPLQLGTPFISAIYLRPGPVYPLFDRISSRQMIRVRHRLNFGGTATGRLPIDPYNRLWSTEGLNTIYLSATSPLALLATTQTVVNNLSDVAIPTVMLQNALTTSGNMTLQGMFGTPDPFISSLETNWIFAYIVFYFAELDPNATAASREFYIQLPYSSDQYINPLNDTNTSQPFVASRFVCNPVVFQSWEPIPLYRGQNSTLGPSLNALEFLEITWPSNLKTIDRDASAIDAIKSHMNLNEWTGDPCVPVPHAWVTCTPIDENKPPEITAVNLSGYNLIGTISPNFADLWSIRDLLLDNNSLSGLLPNLSGLANLKRLYLQDNALSGSLPDWLATTLGLEELFIENNQFSGVIPAAIRSKNSINFRFYPGNPLLQYIALPPIESPPHNKWGVPLFSMLGIVFGIVLLTGSITIFELYRWHVLLRGEYAIAPGATLYSYKVIQKATSNFANKIGEGQSAEVYRGKLDGQEVAVKCFRQGMHSSDEFKNEVNILSEIRHKNLVSLVGYCDDETRLILVYEYMHNNSLKHQLNPEHSTKLDWKARLNIAIGVAQGLKYLHFYCFPRLIHCDIKSANILLAKKIDHAKVSDFGITKLGPDYTHTQSSNTQTNAVGTRGYMDPVYKQDPSQLFTSMDVYSFGVVLYELLIGSGAVSMVEKGEAISAEILDATVRSTMKNKSSVDKVMKIAGGCVQRERRQRPKINEVLDDLIKAKGTEDGTDQFSATTSIEEIA